MSFNRNLPGSSRGRYADTFSMASMLEPSETSTIRRRTSNDTLLSQATTLIPGSASTLRRRGSEDTLLDSLRGVSSTILRRTSNDTLLSQATTVLPVSNPTPLLDQPQLCNNLIKDMHEVTMDLFGKMARIVSSQYFHGHDHLKSRFLYTAEQLHIWEYLVCRHTDWNCGVGLADMEAMLLEAGHEEVYRNVFTALAEYLFLFWNMVYAYVHAGAGFTRYDNLVIRHAGFDYKTFDPNLTAALDAAIARAKAAARYLGVDVRSLGTLEGYFEGQAYASLFDQREYRRKKTGAIETAVMEQLEAYHSRLEAENGKIEEARKIHVARRDGGGR